MPCTGGSDLQVCGLVCRAAAAAAPSSSAVQLLWMLLLAHFLD